LAGALLRVLAALPAARLTGFAAEALAVEAVEAVEPRAWAPTALAGVVLGFAVAVAAGATRPVDFLPPSAFLAAARAARTVVTLGTLAEGFADRLPAVEAGRLTPPAATDLAVGAVAVERFEATAFGARPVGAAAFALAAFGARAFLVVFTLAAFAGPAFAVVLALPAFAVVPALAAVAGWVVAVAFTPAAFADRAFTGADFAVAAAREARAVDACGRAAALAIALAADLVVARGAETRAPTLGLGARRSREAELRAWASDRRRTTAGTDLRPARCAATSRRPPSTTSYPFPTGRSSSGWSTPLLLTLARRSRTFWFARRPAGSTTSLMSIWSSLVSDVGARSSRRTSLSGSSERMSSILARKLDLRLLTDLRFRPWR
jgi:hypothetical protein